LSLASLAPRRPRRQQASGISRAVRWGPEPRQPDFAMRERRLRRAATHAGAWSRSLRSHCQVWIGSCESPSGFTRWLRTWARSD